MSHLGILSYYTKKSALPLILGVSVLLTSACGGVLGETDAAGIASHVQIEPGFQVLNNNEARGIGAIRLLEILPNFSGRSVILKGSLNLQTGGSISVVMYSPNMMVPDNSGVNIRFIRSGAKVIATASVNGNSVSVTSAKMDFYFPANLDVIVEVHNMGSRSRILIWRRDFAVYSAATADVDSERSGDLSAPLVTQTGGGGYVGLRLNQATVTAFQVQLPKVLP